MKLRPTTVLLAVLFAGLVLYAPATRPVTATPASDLPGFTPIQKRLVSGFASFELDPQNVSDLQQPKNYSPRGSGDCAVNTSSNIKVNQNCLNLSDPDLQGRSQAQNETFAAQDPNQPNHMVASFNDYRRGDSTCGVAWSVDKGRTWNDSTAPTGFTRGTAFGPKPREYWQAGGDTSVAWDTKGNAYLSCQVFKRGIGTSPDRDQSNGLYVYRSTGNFGASWNFPGRAVVERNNTAGNFLPLLDKQLMSVDNTVGSPFQDRVYVTWTEFAADGSAYIFEAFSADFCEHFSPPVLVSGNSSLCVITFGAGTP